MPSNSTKPLAEAIAYWRKAATTPEAKRHLAVLLEAAQAQLDAMPQEFPWRHAAVREGGK
jgi:hypothetical protein